MSAGLPVPTWAEITEAFELDGLSPVSSDNEWIDMRDAITGAILALMDHVSEAELDEVYELADSIINRIEHLGRLPGVGRVRS